MIIISFNVNGIFSYIKFIREKYNLTLNDYLKNKLKCDIFLVQELKSTQKKHIGILKDYAYFPHYCQTKNGYSGVAFIISKLLYLKKITTKFEEMGDFNNEGRVIVADLGNFKILNAYFPYINEYDIDQEKRARVHDFYLRIKQVIINNKNMICSGDFNATYRIEDHYQYDSECKAIERRLFMKDELLEDFVLKAKVSELELPCMVKNTLLLNKYFFLMYQRQWLKDFVDDKTHYDVFLMGNMTNKYTCWNTRYNLRPKNLGTRIDFIFVPYELKDMVRGADNMNEEDGSDHCPVRLDININTGQGNNNLLERKSSIFSFIKKLDQ